MIKISDLSKVYKTDKGGTVEALCNINLVLSDRGFVAIVGESGSGKSTLLNIIGAIDTCTTGTIEYISPDKQSFDYTDESERELIRREQISTVLQENFFFDYLSLEENAKLAALIQGKDESTVNEKCIELLERMNLGQRLGHKPSELSGGQKQRASIVRGVTRDMNVLIADEPTGAQDTETEISIFELLKSISKDKLVILVTHSVDLAHKYCDRIIELKNGCISSNVENAPLAEGERSVRFDGNVVYIKNRSTNLDDWILLQNCVDKFGTVSVMREETKSEPVAERPFARQQNNEVKKSGRFGYFGFAFKIFKKRLARTLAMSILSGMILSVLAFMMSIVSYDKPTLENSIFESNEQSNVVFERQYKAYLSSEYKTTMNTLREEYGSIAYPVRLNRGVFWKLDGMNKDKPESTVSSMALVREGDRNLIYGSFAENGECMITDYTASILFEYDSDYNSYEDIVSKGISINGHAVRVSGIIDTDYEKYAELKAKQPKSTEEEKRLQIYGWNVQYEYNCLYYNADMNEQISKDGFYTFAPIHYDKLSADVKTSLPNGKEIVKIYEGEREGVIVSEALYNKILSIPDKIEVANTSILLGTTSFVIEGYASGVGEDEVYVDGDVTLSFLDHAFETPYLMLGLNGEIEPLRYLEEREYENVSGLYVDIIRIESIVLIVKNTIPIVILILLALAFLCLSSCHSMISDSMTKTTGILRAFGCRKGEILRINAVPCLFVGVVTSVVQIISSVLIFPAINTLLSRIYLIEIDLFGFNALITGLVFIMLCVLNSLVWLLGFVKREKQPIRDQLS